MAAAPTSIPAPAHRIARDLPAEHHRHGHKFRWGVILGWTVILVLLLRHREVISSDTLSNYVHVWWAAENLWQGHGLPFHMVVLGHGEALTFPYGFIPWMFAVILWPLMGEWSVTLTLGVGWLLMVLATFYAFPELKKGWWATAVLVNPAFAEGLLLGQLPFMWAAAMLLGAIGCWRRERRGWATVLAAAAQVTHAAVLMPLTAAVVLCWAWRHPEDRRALIQRWMVGVVITLPAAALVLTSPVAEETSPWLSLWIEIETVALRSLVLLVPFGLLYLQRRGIARGAARVAAGLVVYQLLSLPFSSMNMGWGAMVRSPDPLSAQMAASPVVRPGETYRVLAWGDRKWAPYAVVRAGGHLDSEFFPESLNWRSFPDVGTYTRFLTRRQVDYVLVQANYHRFRTNEQALLNTLAAEGRCVGGVAVSVVERTPAYTAYRVQRECHSTTETAAGR